MPDHTKDEVGDVGRVVFPNLQKSGFPFQLAVAAAVRVHRRWDLIREEFPWQDDAGRDRFLDLVIESSGCIATLECKKSDADTWNFLLPGRSPSEKDARCIDLGVRVSPAPTIELSPIKVAAAEWKLKPTSLQSSFW